MANSKSEAIIDHLLKEGYRPSIDEEGDILFEFEGQPLFIHPDEDDPQVLKIFGFAWRSDNEFEDEEDDDSELMLALQVANDCSARHAGVKVITLPTRHIIVAAEQIYEPFDVFQNTLQRILKALKNCAEEVQTMMDADYEDDDADFDFDPESN